MGILVQVIATVLLCFSCLNLGIGLAWPSSTALLFTSENTTLHRPMTHIEIALLGSLPYIGAMVALPLVLIGVLDKLGLKRSTMLTSLLFVISWSLVAVTNRVEAILISAVITGAGNAVFTIITMYISEIVQDSIRGTLTTAPTLAIYVGLLVSYTLGGILEYHMVVYCCLSLAVIGLAMIGMLKDSPVQLMAKGREEDAVKSLIFYRRTSGTSKEILTEISNIRRSLNMELNDAQSLMEVAENDKPNIETKKLSCWQLFKSTPSIRRQLYLSMVLQFAFVFQGQTILNIYIEPIFAMTVADTISPNTLSVIYGLILPFAISIGAFLSDRIGRRPLQIYSSIVSGACCLFLGTQIMMGWFPKWTVPLFIYLYTMSQCTGIGSVPAVVAAEIFLPEVKSQLLMVTYEWGFFCSFSGMFLFVTGLQSFGLATVFYFFAFICFSTTVYFYYYLPETKGLPVYAIQALFTKELVN